VPTTPTSPDPSTGGLDTGGVTTSPTTPTSPTTNTTPSDGGTSAEEWPSDKSGYTVVLASFSQKNYRKADAQIRATQAQSNGISSGVLDSNDFSSLTANLWVVFSGVHDSQSAAEAHERTVRAAGYQGAYVRQVKP
jgi:SPOR domain